MTRLILIPFTLAFALAIALALALPAVAGERFHQEIPVVIDSEVLARHGDVVVTFADVDAHLRRTPAEHRIDVLSDPERIARILEQLVLSRALGQAAIVDGLLEDDEVRTRLYHGVMNVLADEQRNRVLAERELDDYTNQARELYLRAPGAHRAPERFDFTHLLLRVDSEDEEQTVRERIEALAERAAAGESLSGLVEAYSEDPSAASNRGQFRDADPTELDPAFAAALRKLEDGALSGPVRSRFGWHLIRLDAHHPERTLEFEEVADQLRQQARGRHRERINELYLQSLLGEEPEIVEGGIERLLERYRNNP